MFTLSLSLLAVVNLVSADYIGCFRDTPTRALPNYSDQATTVSACNAIAQQAGAKYFGMQFWQGFGSDASTSPGGQCFYGSSDFQIYGSTDDCQVTAAGGYVGGPWANAIYSVSPANQSAGKVLYFENFENGGFKESWTIEKGHWNSGPGIADDARWQFGTGEIQNCTEDSITFNDSKMQITATALPDGTFNSGRIYSNFAVGPKPNSVVRIEAKIQLPAGGKGIWPAFWMLPKETTYGIWPKSGEIDIGEFNTDMSRPYTVLHFGGDVNASPGFPINNGFHTFTLDWTLDSMVFSIDGRVYNTIPKSTWNSTGGSAPYDKEFYIILNLSLGGWAGQPDENTVFPQVMSVEYVKITETPQ